MGEVGFFLKAIRNFFDKINKLAVQSAPHVKKEKMINAKKNLRLYTFFNHYTCLELKYEKDFFFLPNFKSEVPENQFTIYVNILVKRNMIYL